MSVQQDASLYQGEFDLQALADAFKNITVGARTLSDKIEPGTVEIRVRHEENGNTPMAVIEWRGIKNKGATNLFHSFAGGDGLRLAFAAKVIKAHGGDVEQETDILRARLPLSRV